MTRGQHASRRGERPSDPEYWLHFVELDPFAPAWKRLGLGDPDLRDLQITICSNPEDAPVISGTGGLRKLRFAPRGWNTGKRGALRVYYAWFPDFGLIALIHAHAKNEMESITAAQKAAIRGLLLQIHEYLKSPSPPTRSR